MNKRRHALAGLSTRAIYQFALPLLGKPYQAPDGTDFSDGNELAGILDCGAKRVRLFIGKVGKKLPIFCENKIGKRFQETSVSVPLVATPDFAHCENIDPAKDNVGTGWDRFQLPFGRQDPPEQRCHIYDKTIDTAK